MNSRSIKGLMSSAKSDWQTPPELVSLVCDAFGSPISLDPCTSADNPVRAFCAITKDDEVDGLAEDWMRASGGGWIYVNPPYGRDIGRWTDKAVEESVKEPDGDGGEIILLVPARTDAAWWQRCAPKADAVCFLKGRVRFVDPATGERGGPSMFPSALIYFGSYRKRVARYFSTVGWVP